MIFYFDGDFAKEHGVDEAILYNYLCYWVTKNKANDKHFYDGFTWTYNSHKAFGELFPFWSRSKIQRIISSLEEKGFVIKGNYNQLPYDRTTWYALPKFAPSIVQNCTTHCSDLGNGVSKNEQPIPNYYQNTKQITNIKKEKNNKKKKIQNDFSDIFSSYTANADLIDVLYSFLEMRNTLKPKPTVKAMQLVLNKLDKITSDDSIKIQILENSIMHGWKGVFPLKTTQQGEQVNEPTYRIDQEGNKRDEFGCLIL